MPDQPTQSVVTYLTVSPANDAIEFYKRAFGFEEMMRMPAPDGRVVHGCLSLGGTMLFLSDEFEEMCGSCKSPKSLGGSTVTVHLMFPDVDAAFARAVGAGATGAMPPENMFWGDRFAKVIDPFGHHWSLASHVEDVPPDEMKRRADAAFAGWGKK